jgi:hypothetical protein
VVWRSYTAHRQANAAQTQAEVATKGHLQDRLSTAAALLDGDKPSVRRSGLYLLSELANDHPNEFHKVISRLLVGFAWDTSVAAINSGSKTPREFELALDEFSKIRSKLGSGHEFGVLDLNGLKAKDCRFSRLEIANIRCVEGDFEGVNFINSNLYDAIFYRSSFKATSFNGCNLTGADFGRIDMSGVHFFECNISSCDFTEAIGLKPAKLESCWAWKGRPPKLPEGVEFNDYFDVGENGVVESQQNSKRLGRKFRRPDDTT